MAAPGAAGGVRVRPSLTHPTSLEIEAPLLAAPPGGGNKRRGVVQWEGHASGELFTYATLLHCHASSSLSSFYEAEAGATQQQEKLTITTTATATFTLLFPSMADRDALATLLRMGLGGKAKASPPWAEVEGCKAAAVDAAVAEAVGREAAARAELERGRDDGGCVV